MILTIRTDRPEAEIGVYDKTGKQLTYKSWLAHRQLAETIHLVLREVCTAQNSSLYELTGIIAYKGPGSFTGLRIGLTTANTLAYGLNVPIVAATGTEWIADGLRRLNDNQTDRVVLPEYGADVHITLPKK